MTTCTACQGLTEYARLAVCKVGALVQGIHLCVSYAQGAGRQGHAGGARGDDDIWTREVATCHVNGKRQCNGQAIGSLSLIESVRGDRDAMHYDACEFIVTSS